MYKGTTEETPMPALTKTTVTPYLMLNGTAREVMTFYHQAIGGELLLRTYGEGMGPRCEAAIRDQIMHARITSGDFVLMASDSAMGPVPAQPGPGVHLSIGAPEAELARLFTALAEGGSVEHELFDAPWGGKFGGIIDRFGYHWMFASSSG
jgi:PhnB protein